MKHIFLLLTGLVLFAFKGQSQTTVTDYDGNVYNTVTIGTQIWFKENLKVTHYRNGVPITDVTDNTGWTNLITGAYCDYDNISSNGTTYGKLYNFYAVADTRNLCPVGWHVPTDANWTALSDYLGGASVAGGKLKETGFSHWQSPNQGATNQSGFAALPGGNRTNAGTFSNIGTYGYWWSSTESGASMAWNRYMTNFGSGIVTVFSSKVVGQSVRCLSDSTVSINEINNNENIQVFPNPANDRFYINYTLSENAELKVYDIEGKCLFERALTSGMSVVDVKKFPIGVYIICIMGGNWTVKKKLTKE